MGSVWHTSTSIVYFKVIETWTEEDNKIFNFPEFLMEIYFNLTATSKDTAESSDQWQPKAPDYAR